MIAVSTATLLFVSEGKPKTNLVPEARTIKEEGEEELTQTTTISEGEIVVEQVEESHIEVPTSILSEYEKNMLSVLVECEAGSESLEGKIAVAQVVLNRIESVEYPSNLIDVMYQPHQFQPVGDGVVDYTIASEESIYAVELALQGYDVVADSTMFWANYVPSNHEVWNYSVRYQIGVHVFAGYIK